MTTEKQQSESSLDAATRGGAIPRRIAPGQSTSRFSGSGQIKRQNDGVVVFRKMLQTAWHPTAVSYRTSSSWAGAVFPSGLGNPQCLASRSAG